MKASSKICNFDRLMSIRAEAAKNGHVVVHCHGCFDIVHPGHIQHLQYAKSLGDVLIVTVSADSQVNKGIDRPLIPDDLRASSLAALECVDLVHVNLQPTAVELLDQLRPDIYVKGREYERNLDPRFLAERETVEKNGGRVVFSSGDVIYSSTALINSIEQRDSFQDEKVSRFLETYDLNGPVLSRLLSHFRQQKVVVIGDYILDRYHFCDASGVAGEGPMLALRHLQTRDFDGGAAVVAGHLAGLGANVSLITSLADDDDVSIETALRLQNNGIAVESSDHRRQIVLKERFLVDQNKLFKVDHGSAIPLDSAVQRSIAEKIFAAAQNATLVVFADFGYGLITESLLDQIMPELRSSVPTITADVSGRQANLLRFKAVDLLCPTEREVRETLHDFSSGLGAVVWNLLQATQARQALITLGKEGLVTFAPGPTAQGEHGRLSSQFLPALSNHVVDPLGCGDALLATASLTLASGGSLQAAAYLGSLAAAIELQQLGNHPITSERLGAMIRTREQFARLAS